MFQLNKSSKEISEKNTYKKISFEKKLIIITTIISLLIICITVCMIIFKKNNKKDTENIIVNNNEIISDKDFSEIKRFNETDMYNSNPISIINKTETIERNGIKDEISYIEISGLINKDLQNKINTDLKATSNECYNKVIKRLEEKNTKEQMNEIEISVSTFDTFNGCNMLSYSTYGYSMAIDGVSVPDSRNVYDIFCGKTVSLIDGNNILFTDLFTEDANVTKIIEDSLYREYPWYYSDEFFDERTSMKNIDYADLENKIFNMIVKLKEKEYKNIKYAISGNNIIVFEPINNEVNYFKIPISDNIYYINVFGKYTTTENIYLDTSLSIKNIFIGESYDESDEVLFKRSISEREFSTYEIYNKEILQKVDNNYKQYVDYLVNNLVADDEVIVVYERIFMEEENDYIEENLEINFVICDKEYFEQEYKLDVSRALKEVGEKSLPLPKDNEKAKNGYLYIYKKYYKSDLMEEVWEASDNFKQLNKNINYLEEKNEDLNQEETNININASENAIENEINQNGIVTDEYVNQPGEDSKTENAGNTINESENFSNSNNIIDNDISN